MELSRVKKLAIGALTAWPLVYMGVFMLAFFATFFRMAGKHAGAGPPAMFGTLFAFHCFTMVVIVGLMVFYIVHIVKSTFEKPEMKIIWLILVLMGGMIAMPVYWYMNIWQSMQIKRPEEPIGEFGP